MAYPDPTPLIWKADYIVDSDSRVETDPYFPIRCATNEPDIVCFAIFFLVKNWSAHFTGTINYTNDLPPFEASMGTYDFYAQITATPGPNDELDFGMLFPPTNPPVQNFVMTCSGLLPGSAIGTYSNSLGVTGQLVIGPFDSGLPSSLDLNVEHGSNGVTFGCSFPIRIPIFYLPDVDPPDPLESAGQISSDGFNFEFPTESSPITISIPRWDLPGDEYSISFPLWVENALAGNDDYTSDMSAACTMKPIGQTDDPTKPIPLEGVFNAFSPDGIEDSDLRIWNQNGTAHRNPVTRELL